MFWVRSGSCNELRKGNIDLVSEKDFTSILLLYGGKATMRYSSKIMRFSLDKKWQSKSSSRNLRKLFPSRPKFSFSHFSFYNSKCDPRKRGSRNLSTTSSKNPTMPDEDYQRFLRPIYATHEGRVSLFQPHAKDEKGLLYLHFHVLPQAIRWAKPMPLGAMTKVRQFVPDKLGIYFCLVDFQNATEIMPYLPLSYNQTILYPTGDWCGTYTSIEYQRAISLGYDLQIVDGVVFAQQGYLREQKQSKEDFLHIGSLSFPKRLDDAAKATALFVSAYERFFVSDFFL